MAPVNVDPIDAETGEPAEADGPGMTRAQKDKAEFESGLTAAMREAHDRLAASTQSADAAPWSATRQYEHPTAWLSDLQSDYNNTMPPSA